MSHILMVLSMDEVANRSRTAGLKLTEVVALSCAWRVKHGGLPIIRASWQVTRPSSVLTTRSCGLCGFHEAHSTSDETEAEATAVGLRASNTATVRSNDPLRRTEVSVGFHATAWTLLLWCVQVYMQASLPMSHNLTVASPDPLARRDLWLWFHDRLITASVWLPGFSSRCRFFFFFFLSACDGSPFTGPPSSADGSSTSITSRFQISIPGLNVPTAT
mmetsp:Transcript_16029/g.27630  ORF Transcript_16029/g.27630 Transcript_16029/m.27630 type:complete len:218 (-) Transcript_16029:652-1305(-)